MVALILPTLVPNKGRNASTYHFISTTFIKWAIPEKNQTGEVEDIEFPGVLKKEHVEIPGANKIVEFPGVFKKKSCGIAMGLGFWPLNFQGISHKFAEFPGAQACFLWNF